MTHGSTKLPTN